MNMNFFEWLRDGVRQSVLLGVSDAVEQIGTPDSDEKTSPILAGILSGEEKTKPRRKSASRKRLGKSLKDMDSTE